MKMLSAVFWSVLVGCFLYCLFWTMMKTIISGVIEEFWVVRYARDFCICSAGFAAVIEFIKHRESDIEAEKQGKRGIDKRGI